MEKEKKQDVQDVQDRQDAPLFKRAISSKVAFFCETSYFNNFLFKHPLGLCLA
jgi:hypothetical protein